MKNVTTSRLKSWTTAALGAAACLLGVASAEGSVQVSLGSTDAAQSFNQFLFDYDETNTFVKTTARPIYVDILSAGEVINVSLCGTVDADTVRIEIYSPSGTLLVSYTPTTSTSAGKIGCNNALNTVITNAYKYTTTATGTYQVRLFNTSANENHFKRFDVTVTPNSGTNPDPRTNGGRVWAYAWAFNGNNTFAETGATDANYFVRVPGGRTGTEYIWKLDLNRFAGQRYEVIANSIGLDAPNSGYSTAATSTAGTATAQPLHPIYLSYPAQVSSPPTAAPVITGFRFEGANGRPFISPGTSTGVNDSGTFKFRTDVDGTYSITVDTNKDGVFGAGDRRLLGTVASSAEKAVVWDGKDASGNVLAVGNYAAELQVRLGEYHFVAYDVETSGGGASNGLTVYRAISQAGTASTQVYWDDVTKLAGQGGTSNLPGGGTSGTAAGAHTWGSFASGSLGDTRYLDTYVYGLAATALSAGSITSGDAVVSGKVYNDADRNGTVDTGETGIPNATLQLLDSQLNIVRTVQTDTDGAYAFLGVNAGTYTVKVVVDSAVSGKVPTGPDPAQRSVTVTSNTASDNNFGFGPPQADLAITKTDGLSSVVSGQSVTYTVVVSNGGPSTTTASFADTTFSGVTLSNWTCTPTRGTATCPTGLPTSGGYSNGLLNLPAGSSLTFQVTGRVTAASGTISNTATLREPTGTTDPDGTNNSATDTTTVQPAVIAPRLTKTVQNITPNFVSAIGTRADGLPTHTLEYCIAYANEGNVALPNFSIRDALPANTSGQVNGYGTGQGIKVVRGAAAPTYLSFVSPVVVNLGTLAVNESGSVCFRATIN